MRSHPMILALVFAIGCSGKPAEQGGVSSSGSSLDRARKGVEDVIATVDGAPIGAADLRQQASRNPPADGKSHTEAERKALADDLVEEEVLFQEALKKGLYHDSKVRKILVNLLLREEVYSQVRNDSLTDEELQAYYQEHLEDFVTPEKVQVRRILFRIREDRDDAATKAAAMQVYAELRKDPRLFSELASKHSDGPYKRRGGDLGFVSREGKPGVDAEVIEKAFGMQVDGIAAPFLANNAYHILQLVNRRERTERSFDQMKGSVVRMVKQGKHEAIKEKYIADTLAGYKIEVDAKKLAGVDLARRSLMTDQLPMGAEPDAEGDENEGTRGDHGDDH